jgi:hypothetical protein
MRIDFFLLYRIQDKDKDVPKTDSCLKFPTGWYSDEPLQKNPNNNLNLVNFKTFSLLNQRFASNNQEKSGNEWKKKISAI